MTTIGDIIGEEGQLEWGYGSSPFIRNCNPIDHRYFVTSVPIEGAHNQADAR